MLRVGASRRVRVIAGLTSHRALCMELQQCSGELLRNQVSHEAVRARPRMVVVTCHGLVQPRWQRRRVGWAEPSSPHTCLVWYESRGCVHVRRVVVSRCRRHNRPNLPLRCSIHQALLGEQTRKTLDGVNEWCRGPEVPTACCTTSSMLVALRCVKPSFVHKSPKKRSASPTPTCSRMHAAKMADSMAPEAAFFTSTLTPPIDCSASSSHS